MLNAMAKSTMPQVPDFPVVAQALSGPSTATLLHAGSGKDTIGDEIPLNSHLHPLVTPPTTPTVDDRPPAAPDPVTAVQPTFVIGNGSTLSIHSPSLCHDTTSVQIWI